MQCIDHDGMIDHDEKAFREAFSLKVNDSVARIHFMFTLCSEYYLGKKTATHTVSYKASLKWFRKSFKELSCYHLIPVIENH